MLVILDFKNNTVQNIERLAIEDSESATRNGPIYINDATKRLSLAITGA